MFQLSLISLVSFTYSWIGMRWPSQKRHPRKNITEVTLSATIIFRMTQLCWRPAISTEQI